VKLTQLYQGLQEGRAFRVLHEHKKYVIRRVTTRNIEVGFNSEQSYYMMLIRTVTGGITTERSDYFADGFELIWNLMERGALADPEIEEITEANGNKEESWAGRT
jgi:hypothetical protein